MLLLLTAAAAAAAAAMITWFTTGLQCCADCGLASQ
jgi:hypothetical protein